VKLYNSLSKTIEPFQPKGDWVSIYVCGITPYDTTHLGHAFTYTSADILIRYLEYMGLTVRYVQNVTDIDDDILRKAREVGEDWQNLGNRWTSHFIKDLISLNVRPPDFYPRATDVIPEIIALVEKLVKQGCGYESGGNVYFEVASWPEFGRLSAIPYSEMLPVANERGNKPDDPHKRNPLDFVLWQAQSPDEPAWNSPWGPGRPGWHIECSTMSTHFLGETIDIHSGGGDLIFPHHECEIAQIEPVTNKKPFVRFWIHAAMVHHEGAKMSKSLGNLIMVRDLLKTYSPDALRIYLGRHHYRDVWSHSEPELSSAEDMSKVINLALSANGDSGKSIDPGWAIKAFDAALEDDLNTPTACQILCDLAEEIIDGAKFGKAVAEGQEAIRQMGAVFGLQMDQAGPEPRVIDGWNKHLKRFKVING
jgi:L-cysteine:1D-myo-inositol 2-amino-2-deoxy-alpha-D-glucopyranoside ligase